MYMYHNRCTGEGLTAKYVEEVLKASIVIAAWIEVCCRQGRLRVVFSTTPPPPSEKFNFIGNKYTY